MEERLRYGFEMLIEWSVSVAQAVMGLAGLVCFEYVCQSKRWIEVFVPWECC